MQSVCRETNSPSDTLFDRPAIMANRVEPDDNMRPTTRQGPTVSVSARSLDPEDVDTTPMKLKPGFTRMSLCAVDEVR